MSEEGFGYLAFIIKQSVWSRLFLLYENRRDSDG